MARSRRQQIRAHGAQARQRRVERRRTRTARAQVGIEFNPAMRAARAEAKGSAKREKQIGQWYDQLATDYGSATQAAQSAYSTAEQATNQRIAEAASRRSSTANERTGKEDAYSKLLGAPKATQDRATEAAANASADQQAATLAAPLTAARANQVAYLGTRATSARMRGIEARKAEGERRRKIKSDIQAARREKGQATVTAIDKLTRADRESAAERAALGQKARQFGVTARQTQARIGISRRNAATSERNAATSERSQHATARHYKETGGKHGLTPSQRNTIRQHNRDAMSAARSQLKTQVPKSPEEWGLFEQALVERLGGSYSREIAQAVKRLRHGRAKRHRTAPLRIHR